MSARTGKGSAADLRRLAQLVSVIGDPIELGRRARAVGDWGALYRTAFEEGVGGLLHVCLGATGVETPAEVEAQVEGVVARDRLWCAKLSAELRRVQDTFDRAGIRVVVLKGVVLAERFYPETALRPVGDLDLLVDPEAFGRAVEALRALGYRRADGTSDSLVFATDGEGVPHEVRFLAPARAPVELHHHASSGFRTQLAATALIRRSIVHRTAGQLEVRILEPVDEALYLAIHAARHCFVRLGWLHELAIAIQRLDPQQLGLVVERARSAGVARALAVALAMLERGLAWTDRERFPADLELDARVRLAVWVGGLAGRQESHPSGLFPRAYRWFSFHGSRALLGDSVTEGARHLAREVALALRRRVPALRSAG